jgi:hypothetical protein
MSQAAVSILRATILNAVAANMLSNYECMFRKAGITEANSAFKMWSDARFPAAAPTLAEFLNWMPSTEPPDDGAAEDIQESAEAALARDLAAQLALSLSLITPNKLIDVFYRCLTNCIKHSFCPNAVQRCLVQSVMDF